MSKHQKTSGNGIWFLKLGKADLSLWLTQKLEKDMTFSGVYLDFDFFKVKVYKYFSPSEVFIIFA